MNDNKNVGARFIEPVVRLSRRKDIRLKSYDYKSNGYYFITICTYKRKPYIKKYEEILEKILLSLPERFSGLTIDWYILMPTHLHMIFVFNETKKDLSEIIRTFKALVSRNTKMKFWQRNYYEHVIRNEDALLKIREYIQNNPLAENIKFEEFYEDGSDKSDPYRK
ncbi:MAG: transposase [Candidatus Caldatribacteriota bacterium]|nr:transposase [Candidatus Caldatribacteriota bacterium]